jgi:UDP-N-acetylmuramoylalanine--D-glutamate ligase
MNTPYAGKKIAVLGLGRSGLAAARLMLRSGASVTVLDEGESGLLSERAALLEGEGAVVLTGKKALSESGRHDLAVLSPGIEETAPMVVNLTSRGVPLIGELELAFSLCKCPVIAITGSNGKTTTTELATRMLLGAGYRAASCGNIGTPMSELVASGEEWDLLVAEVSSFQLETTRTFHPKVALWLNLTPNHLDRYPSMKEYREAKLRIFMNQTSGDWAVVPQGDHFSDLKARRITFSTTDPSADLTLEGGTRILHRGNFLLDLSATRLRGPHNAANLMAAFGAGIAIGADPARMASAIGDYTPPAHRCELIATRRGVAWINDSKATTLDAMAQAIRSVNGPLIVIAGGKDKGFGFAPIAPLLRERAAHAVLIGEMGNRIAADWAPLPTTIAGSLEDAVSEAARRAKPGSTVLFSPGTSSFDMFRDYLERGETFRRLVLALPETATVAK